MHEDFHREQEVKVGSERSFGLVFAAVFSFIALVPLMDGKTVRWWALVVAAVFLVAGLAAPNVLRPLNLLWFKFGLLLYKVVNPLVMALLYYLTIVPTGILMRLSGKDPLNRTFDPKAESYWIDRDPPGPEPTTMKRQF